VTGLDSRPRKKQNIRMSQDAAKNIGISVVATLLAAGIAWLASNAVFASDLQQLEQRIETKIDSNAKEQKAELSSMHEIIVRREIRDISREIRVLKEKEALTDRESQDLADLESDLRIAEMQMDKILEEDDS
jgi:hypothetical protein